LVNVAPKDIVILGAGVAGIRAALDLEKKIDSRTGRIVLVDENDYHQYLYKIQEVCNKDYEEKDIIVPIFRLIKGKNIEFIKASVRTVDPERRVVDTTGGEIPYDILVIALGSHIAYFGIEGLEENSLTLSSFEAAREIRSRIEELFKEVAQKTFDTLKFSIRGFDIDLGAKWKKIKYVDDFVICRNIIMKDEKTQFLLAVLSKPPESDDIERYYEQLLDWAVQNSFPDLEKLSTI